MECQRTEIAGGEVAENKTGRKGAGDFLAAATLRTDSRQLKQCLHVAERVIIIGAHQASARSGCPLRPIAAAKVGATRLRDVDETGGLKLEAWHFEQQTMSMQR